MTNNKTEIEDVFFAAYDGEIGKWSKRGKSTFVQCKLY